MRIVGYADRLSARPGDKIRFQVSCSADSYQAGIVRLRHGDLDGDGPGFKAEPVTSSVDGVYTGREQRLHPGSYVIVDDAAPLHDLHSVTLTAWIYVTAFGEERRGILTRWSEERGLGFGLFVTGDGKLTFRLGDGRQHAQVQTDEPVRTDSWYFVAAVVDGAERRLRLHLLPATTWSDTESGTVVETATEVDIPGQAYAPLLMGASHLLDAGRGRRVAGNFNGKIDGPRLHARALSPDQIEAIAGGASADADGSLVARWDLSLDIASDVVRDVSGNGLHGTAVNMPTRAVTGHNWTGEDTDFRNVREQYDAIYFHDDDLDDAGWETDFEFTVPSTWRSGVYAAALTTDGFEEYIPFVVRPAPDGDNAPVAFLLPTLTYMAYANEHMWADIELDELLEHGTEYERSAFRYILDNRQNSLYDMHSDGSGVRYSSRLRPIVNMRPKYNKPGLYFRHPHGLSCDLYTIDWLQENGYDFDVITDEDLHHEGTELVHPYRVVVTGSHPEYWTWPMLSSLRAYLAGGGRLMYLGGNGFYWVSSLDAQRPHVLEVRRGHSGSRRWTSRPGEVHHSTTGEVGGLWRFRAYPPQATVGVGCSALLTHYSEDGNEEHAHPYRRTAQSRDPRAAFIFEGIEEDVIGDFGLHLGAAAGWELDRADPTLGTPPHALVVATSAAGDNYQPVVEEIRNTGTLRSSGVRDTVRADIVFYEGPNGGAVFSVGSITWSGSLSHANYANSVSRMTANVLNRFLKEEPFSS